jgi:geranylgeranyl pyrophosphate synthase
MRSGVPPLRKESAVIADPLELVREEMALVESRLTCAVASREKLLTEICLHLVAGGGKRLRPLVALMAFKMMGGTRTEAIVDMAAALELIHTATLLHDDIIDDGEQRRGKPSAYKCYGLTDTLVAGDFLFIKAFEFAGKFDERVVQWTSDACTSLTEGEILQSSYVRNPKVTLKEYIEIVERKTACLFHAGAKIGAYLAGAPDERVRILGDFGLNLGICFQIMDDILDVVGTEEILGKPVGMDLKDGNPSLPIILAIKMGKRKVRSAFEGNGGSIPDLATALEEIKKSGAIARAHGYSRRYALNAEACLRRLPFSEHREGMERLVDLLVDRTF